MAVGKVHSTFLKGYIKYIVDLMKEGRNYNSGRPTRRTWYSEIPRYRWDKSKRMVIKRIYLKKFNLPNTFSKLDSSSRQIKEGI